MSCGAFGGSGNCGGGGAPPGGAPPGAGLGGCPMTRRCADRGFFDPFSIPQEKPRCEPTCYFNPFVHAQCLGVDLNMQGFRNDILKCQEDYKKAVWAVLKKYAVGGDGGKGGGGGGAGGGNTGNSNGNNSANYNRIPGGNPAGNSVNTSNIRPSNGIPFDLSLLMLDDPRIQKMR